MTRRNPPTKRTPSDRELDILDALWDLGSGTVADVQERLSAKRGVDLAYTTVLTILRTLELKGWVRHTPEGKAHRYHPTVERHRARASAIRDLVESLYDGSQELLVTSLVSDRRLSPRVLERLRRLLNDRLKEGGR